MDTDSRQTEPPAIAEQTTTSDVRGRRERHRVHQLPFRRPGDEPVRAADGRHQPRSGDRRAEDERHAVLRGQSRIVVIEGPAVAVYEERTRNRGRSGRQVPRRTEVQD